MKMDEEQAKGIIARRVALELRDGDVVNLGIGIPTLVPAYLPKGVRVVIHAENGIVGAGPRPPRDRADPLHVIDAGGAPVSVLPGGCFIDSALSFGLIRGGHVNCAVLGALEADALGNLANWIIPGKKVPGMGGAMDLVAGARRVIVAMEHTAKGKPKILEKCRLPLTAIKCVDRIITEMAVFDVTDECLLLRERNHAFSMDEIRAATGAPFSLARDMKFFAGYGT
jgi:acetate CoA/acetoacetate CoA-transferase beta subunit